MSLYVDENYFNTDENPSQKTKKIRLWVEEGGCGVVATDSEGKQILAAWSISEDEIARWEETTSFLGKTWDALCSLTRKKEELATFQRFLQNNPTCHIHLVGNTCVTVLKLGVQYHHRASPLKIQGTKKIVFQRYKGFRLSKSQS